MKKDGSPVMIPLFKITPEPAPRRIYVVDGDSALVVVGIRPESLYISHFENCPHAGNFSRRNKSPKETE